MELRKQWDFRKILFVVYFVFFAIYLIVGLQPAGATTYEIATELTIPSLGLQSDVTRLDLNDHELKTPDTIVGSFSRMQNKTLLVGHSSTVFEDLQNIKVGDEIIYDYTSYRVTQIAEQEKNNIDMNEILATEAKDTIVLMTCAGEELGNGDATRRLVVTAEAL